MIACGGTATTGLPLESATVTLAAAGIVSDTEFADDHEPPVRVAGVRAMSKSAAAAGTTVIVLLVDTPPRLAVI
jgi:hypothetical protein